MTVDGLAKAFQNHYDKCVAKGKPPVYMLSVNCVPGFDLDQTAERANRPNPELRVSEVTAIEATGFGIAETPGRRDLDGHCDVWGPEGPETMPSLEALAKLAAAFPQRVANTGRS